jgi:membrane protein implicated in regulation of membrane protease activity
MTRLLVIVFSVLALIAFLTGSAVFAMVGVGTALHYLVPSITFEFACVMAGLAILIVLAVLLIMARLLRVATLVETSVDQDDDEEEAQSEFAEQVAELVTERLRTHAARPVGQRRRRH